MTIQQLIISEVAHQPEPVLRELWHYLKQLKSKAAESTPAPQPVVRTGYGSVPGIILADDFDAPLDEFADYRP